jgi:phage terminase large subunit
MKLKINLKGFYQSLNKKFWLFFENKSFIRISYGGAGSGKSFSTFQEMIYKIVVEPGHNYLVLRKVANTNRVSTYPLTQQIISAMGLDKVFKENKSNMSFTVKHNKGMIVCRGLDDIEKIKSITFPNGVLTDIIIEEASEITQADLNQLIVRLRGMAIVPFQITLLFNPISDQHWIKKEFFDLQSYQKKYSVYILKTTYKDNAFLNKEYKETLEGMADIDYETYRVYCLGEWGHYGNLIFTNWSVMPCPYREEDFDSIYCGMDFGFQHPSVIVKIGFKDGAMYTYNELCCEQKTNMEFIELNKEFNILMKNQQCRADSAEPARIKEWVQNGHSVIPATKGKDSVSRGIDFINSQKWFIDPICQRTIQEVQMYHRKTKKDGSVLEEPVDIFDDAIKSHIYGLEPLSKSQGPPGVLSGTITDQKKKLIQAKAEERRKFKEVLKARRRAKKEIDKTENMK